MFDVGQLTPLQGKALREAVEATVRGAIQDGTYTHTEHHLSKEPYRTMGFEYLDAIKPDSNGRPIQDGVPETWDGQKFLFVSLDPNKGIKLGIVKDEKVAGTNKIKRAKRAHDFGTVAEIPDVPGNRWARQIGYQQTWPVLQTMGDRDTASCVEWAWLEKDANSSNPAPGVVELYEALKPRVDAYLAAKNGPKTPVPVVPPVVEASAPKRRGRPPKTNDSNQPGVTPPDGV